MPKGGCDESLGVRTGDSVLLHGTPEAIDGQGDPVDASGTVTEAARDNMPKGGWTFTKWRLMGGVIAGTCKARGGWTFALHSLIF